MRTYLISRPRLLAERTVSLCLIVAIFLLATPYAQGQQNQDNKNKQPQTTTPKKTDTPTKRRTRRKVSLLESYKLSVELGVRTFDLSGGRPGKFEQYRDFTNGLTVRNLFLDFETPESPYVLKFKGLEMGERDQRFSAEAWKIGKFRTKVL